MVHDPLKAYKTFSLNYNSFFVVWDILETNIDQFQTHKTIVVTMQYIRISSTVN